MKHLFENHVLYLTLCFVGISLCALMIGLIFGAMLANSRHDDECARCLRVRGYGNGEDVDEQS